MKGRTNRNYFLLVLFFAVIYRLYIILSFRADYSLLYEVSETTYIDTDVVNETPYYYYIIAKSAMNTSNGSEPILSVPSDIFITKKSYGTVYTAQATLQGVVDQAGTLELAVNDEKRETVNLVANQMFDFVVRLEEGRNDVNLHFTDDQGKITRITFNFVYLTNYDMEVDPAYTGEEGTIDQSGITQFSTVQAAVDAVPSDNQDRVVILVKEGTYVEHLRVTSPYISLIGEDRDIVNIKLIQLRDQFF